MPFARAADGPRLLNVMYEEIEAERSLGKMRLHLAPWPDSFVCCEILPHPSYLAIQAPPWNLSGTNSKTHLRAQWELGDRYQGVISFGLVFTVHSCSNKILSKTKLSMCNISLIEKANQILPAEEKSHCELLLPLRAFFGKLSSSTFLGVLEEVWLHPKNTDHPSSNKHFTFFVSNT